MLDIRCCYAIKMDKILAYVLDNLKHLTPFQLLLVLLLTILSSTAVFIVLRWLFASRLEAQRELLQMKSEQVNELKARFSELKVEGTQLSEELARAKGSLTIAPPPAAALANLSALRVRLTIVALMWLHTVQDFRAGLWSILAIYAELELPIRSSLPSAPPVARLRERLDHVTELFRTVDFSPDAFKSFEPAIQGDVNAPYPTGLITFPFQDTSETLESLRTEIDGWLEAFFKELESKQLGSP